MMICLYDCGDWKNRDGMINTCDTMMIIEREGLWYDDLFEYKLYDDNWLRFLYVNTCDMIA